MAETNRLSVIAKAGVRPPAHGFEHPVHHADRTTRLSIVPAANACVEDSRLDHFIKRDGMLFAGTHLIVDLWHASNLDDLPVVEQALRDAAARAGATLLNFDLHHFSPNGGISGVVVLAESYISIHTWPEISSAVVDIFMCGAAQPHKAIDVLKCVFLPGLVTLAEHKRGAFYDVVSGRALRASRADALHGYRALSLADRVPGRTDLRECGLRQGAGGGLRVGRAGRHRGDRGHGHPSGLVSVLACGRSSPPVEPPLCHSSRNVSGGGSS
jgi:S-adenosylmethionine decarboxylase